MKTLLLSLALLLSACGSAPPHPLAAPASALHGLSQQKTKQPLLSPVLYNGREDYQLVSPWHFVRFGAVEDAPVGLVVDGASVPRVFWSFMPRDGLHRAAALSHDIAYGLRGRLVNGLVLTRSQADEMFYDLMVEAGVSRFRAGTAYSAVRAGGWVAWAKSSGTLTVLPVPEFAPMGKPPLRLFQPRHLYAAP